MTVISTGKTNTSFGDCFGIDQIYTKAIPKARVCFACGYIRAILSERLVKTQ